MAESSFADWIVLPAGVADGLDWSREIAEARARVSGGRKVVWKLDLGLEEPFFPLDDEMRFAALGLALKRFVDVVWPEFRESTLALCLYRGSADWEGAFLWSERQKCNYREWLEEVDCARARRIFAAEAFAIYFQMLAHRLPDEAPIFILFDLRSIQSVSEMLQVVSKERFEHFLVARRDSGVPIEGFIWDDEGVQTRRIETGKGIVFPEARGFEESFDRAVRENPDGKILYETFLIEDWQGLDELIVMEGSLGLQGERKLKGFVAAGGEIRGRGI